MSKKAAYEGILKEPLKRFPPSRPGEDAPTPEQTAWKKQYLAKLLALFSHYGIKESEPHAHLHLIEVLAHEHVPGFKIRGRRPFKGGAEAVQARANLLATVQAKLAGNPSRTKTAVLRRLAEDPGPLAPYYRDRPHISYETLRNDLRDAELEAAISEVDREAAREPGAGG